MSKSLLRLAIINSAMLALYQGYAVSSMDAAAGLGVLVTGVSLFCAYLFYAELKTIPKKNVLRVVESGKLQTIYKMETK